MKRMLLSLFIIGAFLCQAQTTNTITNENYANEVFKGVNIVLPNYRQINSGSKLVVTYEGDWPEEMVGAFEYAAKLWEEVLPLTLPIKITAKLEPIRGSRKTISKVGLYTYDFNGNCVSMYASPLSMIKSVLLKEYHSTQQHRFNDEISDVSILDSEDMTITYNQNMIGEFSFSLDGEADLNKYDFVTIAMRDIAIGLGFTTRFTANAATQEMNITGGRLTPFETHVYGSIGSNDPKTAYVNATKGSLAVTVGAGNSNKYSMYAPSPWENGVSLRYFIPDTSNPITRLLTYDFGKGYIVRDLSGIDWDNFFTKALDWRRELATGATSGGISQSGTSRDVIAYRGTISLSFPNRIAQKLNTVDLGHSSDINVSRSRNRANSSNDYVSTDDYCTRFNLFSPQGAMGNAVSLSVLLKNGEWDCIKIIPEANPSITLNVQELQLNYDENQYARGTTGGLRYRLTQCTTHPDFLAGGVYKDYAVKYFTRDFTPQQAQIKYSKIHSDENLATYSSPTVLSDEYFIDVEVGIRNVEGTTKVVVEQLDEGEALPFQYEVYDFRKGYFIANLDRELTTQLKVISYNANGYATSNIITIPPLGYADNAVLFTHDDNYITIEGVSKRILESGQLSCVATNISRPGASMETLRIQDNQISINDLSAGIYVLSMFNNKDKIGEYKFIR